MEQRTKSEYMGSYEYKSVLILSRLRRFACLEGSMLAEKLNLILREILSPNAYVYDNSFLILVETGHIQLNDEAIKIYAEYVASAFKYDSKKLYNAVKYEAMRLELCDDDARNNKALIKAVSGIYEGMK